MERLNKLSAIIFDMDGVIIDSNPLIIIAWKALFKKYDITLTEEKFNQYVFGRTAAETVKLVFPEGLAMKLVKSYANEVAAEVQRLYVSNGQILEGFTKFVKLLSANHMPMAIATSAPAESVKIVLKLADVNNDITIITDASQVHNSKPHPEVYLKTAARLGIDPVSCCVFEDSFSGIKSAKDAGMKVIGITSTHSLEELAASTDAVINNFTNIDIDKVEVLCGFKLHKH